MSAPDLPILYSFRRCPYAMRARLAVAKAGIRTELREVVLKDKPPQMLEISPKGTVPVLYTADRQVIDESLDVMFWALNQHDPDSWWQPLNDRQKQLTLSLIEENDGAFKLALDRYKYADRHPERSQLDYRHDGEKFLQRLEQHLEKDGALVTTHISLADIAIMPFIRQFAFVDKAWFDISPYPELRRWLEGFLDSTLFQRVMKKYPQWQPGDPVTVFPPVQGH